MAFLFSPQWVPPVLQTQAQNCLSRSISVINSTPRICQGDHGFWSVCALSTLILPPHKWHVLAFPMTFGVACGAYHIKFSSCAPRTIQNIQKVWAVACLLHLRRECQTDPSLLGGAPESHLAICPSSLCSGHLKGLKLMLLVPHPGAPSCCDCWLLMAYNCPFFGELLLTNVSCFNWEMILSHQGGGPQPVTD